MARLVFLGQDREYLDGSRLSSGRKFRTSPTPLAVRSDRLLAMAVDRRVLHVGFADHPEVIDVKRREGRWLHGELGKVAARLVGVDTNETAVAHCRALGIPDVYCCPVTQFETLPGLQDEQFDLVLLGEVLEHVGNPVQFLTDVRVALSDAVGSGELVVTVPNAWDVETLARAVCGSEYINTDHRFAFTPYTLAKVVEEAGFGVRYVDTVNGFHTGNSPQGWLFRRFTQRFGLLRTGLLLVADWPARSNAPA